MARSRRKTPITGLTTSPSDRAFKAQEHRKERRATSTALASDQEPPHAKAFGNPWNGPKDGKALWGLDYRRFGKSRRPWDAK